MGLNHKVIFGMKLRQFREQAGLSLTDLGARIRLSTSYLTEIEHGKKYPKAEKIARMAARVTNAHSTLVLADSLSAALEEPRRGKGPSRISGPTLDDVRRSSDESAHRSENRAAACSSR